MKVVDNLRQFVTVKQLAVDLEGFGEVAQFSERFDLREKRINRKRRGETKS